MPARSGRGAQDEGIASVSVLELARSPLTDDLEHVLAQTRDLWDDLRGQRVFITGGTGFIGTWLLASFAWANDRLGLGARATVLTRAPDIFLRRAGYLAAHPAIELLAGDVVTFHMPEGKFSHVIHAATFLARSGRPSDPLALLNANLRATRRVLRLACRCGARRFLFTSSGAVYGRQPPELARVPEEYVGAPEATDLGSAYGHSKRLSELLTVGYAARHGLEPTIARCFAFVGPYLPFDRRLAIGNFLADALRGGPIEVLGDGTPVRSYLYAADLASWLWTIFLRGQAGRTYNVGSEEAVSIAEVARAVADAVHPGAEIRIAGAPRRGVPAERYVPATRRAREELGLREDVGLAEAISRTATWARRQRVT